MNFIVISPHFPHNYELFVVALRNKGVNVIGIGDASFEQLSKTLKDNLIEYYKVDSMENYDEMYRAVAYLAFKHGKIDRLESHNEYWLIQDSRLRTDFNIPGLKYHQIDSIKYKSKMKETFKKAKINVAHGRVFSDLKDATRCAKECGFPVIIKPDVGVGGADTHKVNSQAELEALFLDLKHGPYIMEAFLDGDIVTFDGLCDQDGMLVYYSSLVYNQTTLDSLIYHKEMTFFVNPKIDKELLRIGKKAVKAFNVKERFFHLEFFKMADGSYYGLEMNNRPPGGHALDLMNFANDINLYAEYANIVCDNEFSAHVDNKYYAYYIGRFTDQWYQYSTEDIILKYPDVFFSIIQVPDVYADLMGNIAVIVRHQDIETIKTIEKDVLSKV